MERGDLVPQLLVGVGEFCDAHVREGEPLTQGRVGCGGGRSCRGGLARVCGDLLA